jgi:hypothetical protein
MGKALRVAPLDVISLDFDLAMHRGFTRMRRMSLLNAGLRADDGAEANTQWVRPQTSPFSSPMKALVKSPSDGRIKILSLRLPAIAERSSPATRQSTIAKRAPGLASGGRRSGKYRFAGPAGTRSRSPADLVVSPCILSLSSPHACGVFELHFTCAVHSEPGHSPIGARHGTRHTL